jgi:hypothetical protein
VAPQTGTVFPWQNLLDVGLTPEECFGAAGAVVAAAARVQGMFPEALQLGVETV